MNLIWGRGGIKEWPTVASRAPYACVYAKIEYFVVHHGYSATILQLNEAKDTRFAVIKTI